MQANNPASFYQDGESTQYFYKLVTSGDKLLLPLLSESSGLHPEPHV